MSLAINVLIHAPLVACWNAAASGLCITAARAGTRGMATVDGPSLPLRCEDIGVVLCYLMFFHNALMCRWCCDVSLSHCVSRWERPIIV